jgi:glutamate racemase
MGPGVTLVDSAAETARTVAEILSQKKCRRPDSEQGNHHYYVSDIPAGFIRIGKRFLGERLGDVYQVNLEEDGEEC